MKSFLATTIREICDQHPHDLGEIVLVLPSKRAGAFLRKELGEIINTTTFLPTIYSIEDFVQEISNLEQAGNLHLLFEFYKTYQQVTPGEQQDKLYEFTSWAQTAIQDFNEIDRYLIDPDKIFDHLFSIKELDHWTNAPDHTKLQKDYLNFWKHLKELYYAYRDALSSRGLGYQGMIYREASEQVEYYLQAQEGRAHYFIGFNALNKAESHIIQEILANAPGEIYWDADQHFLNDPNHDAGLFLRRISTEWPHVQKNGFKHTGHHYTGEKNIELIGVPGNIQQAKYIGNLLTELQSQPGNMEKTAVILGQEALLPAVLNAIPDAIPRVNITSGFPLQFTPFASFFEILLHSWNKTKDNKWYYRDVDRILSHPACQGLVNAQETDQLLKTMGRDNLIYLSATRIREFFKGEDKDSGLSLLFPENTDNTPVLIANCTAITLKLRDHYREQDNKNTVFLQYLYRFCQLFNQLQHIQDTYSLLDDLRALLQVYRDLLTKETVDFKGEPLSGLQVMGMLESRNLDFETVIISSVNEGVLPGGKSQNSFIPFDLKLHYGLPTYKEKDAVYTYHFYRLLQRAKNIYLLYNTSTDSLDGGEKSRFIQQLQLENIKNHKIREVLASPHIDKVDTDPAQIIKSESLVSRLREVAQEGFSPSSLSNYIRNPIDFYKQRVLGIRELEMVEETVAANTMGTIVHDTLEELYTPYINKTLELPDLKTIRSNLQKVVDEKFREFYSDPATVRGQNLISYHIARRYVEKYLDYEEQRLKKGQRIRILALENNIPVEFSVPGLEHPVILKGKVDRIEEVNGVWTVVDYKTGAVAPADLKIYDWDPLIEDYKYSKAFQVLCYVYMMKDQLPEDFEVQAGIVSLKSMNNGFMPFTLSDGPKSKNITTIINREILQEFEIKLFELIRNICTPELPFVEKEIETHGY